MKKYTYRISDGDVSGSIEDLIKKIKSELVIKDQAEGCTLEIHTIFTYPDGTKKEVTESTKHSLTDPIDEGYLYKTIGEIKPYLRITSIQIQYNY